MNKYLNIFGYFKIVICDFILCTKESIRKLNVFFYLSHLILLMTFSFHSIGYKLLIPVRRVSIFDQVCHWDVWKSLSTDNLVEQYLYSGHLFMKDSEVNLNLIFTNN